MAGSEAGQPDWSETAEAASRAVRLWQQQHPRATDAEVAAALDGLFGELQRHVREKLALPPAASTLGTIGSERADVTSDIVVRRGVEFARHEGVSLRGDLYRPSTPGPHPALVLVHGGGWQAGSPAEYRHWGAYLASQGYVAFAATYRPTTAEWPSYPSSVQDVRAAVQFLRGGDAEADVDPVRIGLLGSSSGGHLTALVALAGDSPRFAPADPTAYRGVSARVKVAVPVYGVFNLLGQWEYNQLTAPTTSRTAAYLGGTPMEVRDRYYEASPLNWATVQNRGVDFLVVWGTADVDVPPASQSLPFVIALQRAGFFVRIVQVADAPHFWMSETRVLEPDSPTAYLAPRLLRFLAARL